MAPPVSWRRRVVPAVLALPIASVVASLGVAGTPPPTPAPESTTALVTWIRPEEVAVRADRLTRELEAVPPAPATRETVERIRDELAELVPSIEALLDRGHASLSRSTPFVELEDVRRELAATDKTLGGWSVTLAAEAKRVAEALDEIARARAEWTETRRHEETAAAGETVVRRVEGSIAALDDAVANLQPWRAEVLTLSDQVIDQRGSVTTVEQRIQAATAIGWTHILDAGRAPLWRAHLAERAWSELGRVPALMATYGRTTRAYVERDVRPLLVQAVVALVLMWLLHQVARRASASSAPLAHPYATAWLLVLLATPGFHPLGPQRFRQLLVMAALLPASRILRDPERPRSPIGMPAFLALLLLDRLVISAAPLPAFGRVMSLVEITAALVLAAYAVWRAPRIGAPAWTGQVARWATAGLVAALVAEIGGWDGLAAVLGRGIAGGAVLAYFVGAAIAGAEPVVLFVLRIPVLRATRIFDDDPVALRRRVGLVLRAIGAYAWLAYLLRGVGLHEVARDALRSALRAGISVGALSISVSTVLAFAATLVATVVVARTLTAILEQDVYPRTQLPRGVPFVLSTLARYTVYAFGIFFALAAGGIQLSQLAIVLGGVGVGVGLGLQDLVKNFAAGITLLLERRVHPGDVVQIPSQQIFGRVMAIGMRATLVRGWDGSEIVVPNGDLIAGAITNWTLSDRLCRLEVAVGVAYGTDPERVIALLREVVRADDRLLENPPPQAIFVGFGASSLDFLLRAWTDRGVDERVAMTSDLALAVHRALAAANIAIPFPQQDLHLASVAPDAAAALAGAGRRER